MTTSGVPLILFVMVMSVTAARGQCATKYDSAINRSIYITADKMPAFKGGIDSLTSRINKYLKWPGSCCIEGSVYISFIVEPDGRITNRRIKRGISSGKYCDADGHALRVIDHLTNWTIGECGGEKVAVEIIVPIRYSLRR